MRGALRRFGVPSPCPQMPDLKFVTSDPPLLPRRRVERGGREVGGLRSAEGGEQATSDARRHGKRFRRNDAPVQERGWGLSAWPDDGPLDARALA